MHKELWHIDSELTHVYCSVQNLHMCIVVYRTYKETYLHVVYKTYMCTCTSDCTELTRKQVYRAYSTELTQSTQRTTLLLVRWGRYPSVPLFVSKAEESQLIN